MTKIKVSGCIVTYNESETIVPCVQSLLEYTRGVDFQLYISDNCSQDETVELIQKRFPEVKILKNETNGGFGYGHDQVMEFLDSDYHVVINPDIFVKEDTIRELVAYLEAHPEAGMVTPRILNPDGSEQFLPKRPPSIRYVILSKFRPFRKHRRFYTREDDHLDTSTPIEFCTGCFFAIRTSLFKELGGFDRRYYMYFEDADLSRMVLEQGYEIIFHPAVAVYHIWHRANTRTIKGIVRFLSSMVKYFQKWGWRFC